MNIDQPTFNINGPLYTGEINSGVSSVLASKTYGFDR